MKNIALVSIILFQLVGLSVELIAEEFSHEGKILVTQTAIAPVKTVLPYEVLKGGGTSMDGFRLFDEKNKTIPYIIARDSGVSGSISNFKYSILSYTSKGDTDEVVISPSLSDAGMMSLTLDTKSIDFDKSVQIFTSQDQSSWEIYGEERVFDYSSRITLRKVNLDKGISYSRYIKLVFKDMQINDSSESIELEYKDLKLKAAGNVSKSSFKIDGFLGSVSSGKSRDIEMDSFERDLTRSIREMPKSTIIHLGQIGIPIEKIELQAKGLYFHRRVRLLGGHDDNFDNATLLSTHVIYKLPGGRAERLELSGPFPESKFLFLEVMNEDNAPIEIQSATFTWVRTYMVFIPEDKGVFTLKWGGSHRQKPHYDIINVLGDVSNSLMLYNTFPISEIIKIYPPTPDNVIVNEPSWAPDWQLFLQGFVLLSVIVMSMWCYSLLKTKSK